MILAVDDENGGFGRAIALIIMLNCQQRDRQNRVQRRPVELGIQGSLLAEVRSGLQENDRVVLGNAARYKDGELVTPRVEPRPANDVMHEEGGMTDAANDGGN